METRTDGFRKTGADHTEVMLDIAIDALKSHDTIQRALKRTGVTVGPVLDYHWVFLVVDYSGPLLSTELEFPCEKYWLFT